MRPTPDWKGPRKRVALAMEPEGGTLESGWRKGSSVELAME